MKKRKRTKNLRRVYDNSKMYGDIRVSKPENYILPPRKIRRNFQRREK